MSRNPELATVAGVEAVQRAFDQEWWEWSEGCGVLTVPGASECRRVLRPVGIAGPISRASFAQTAVSTGPGGDHAE